MQYIVKSLQVSIFMKTIDAINQAVVKFYSVTALVASVGVTVN